MFTHLKVAANRSASTLLALLALILVATAVTANCGGSSSSQQGADAPEFSLPVANGAGKISLAQFKGEKNVVLVFYRGFF